MIELRELNKKDYDKVIDFAIVGMHFERYTQDEKLLKLYGRYFLYLEMGRASQIICAYENDKLIGLIMADIYGEEKYKLNILQKLYRNVIEFIMNKIMKGPSSPYDEANKAMLDEYKKDNKVDGEICFLAADPNIHGKGIGTLLLKELEKREKGKNIYLYTDCNCTYQFYEHKGFERVGEKEIEMDIAGQNVPLTCFLYAKKL